MSRNTRAGRKRKQRRKWSIAVSLLILVVILSSAAFLLYPKNTPANTVSVPEGLQTLANHYIQVMQNLNSTQTKTTLRAQLNSNYNQTDIFNWQKTKMNFTDDSTWKEDPIAILASGKGICVQWSVVYVSAALALDYPSRLVAAVDTGSWNFIHVWAEDYYNGTWVHVDPSDGVWNEPSRYQSWDWGSGIGSNVRIYAFEAHVYYDVTSKYSLKG